MKPRFLVALLLPAANSFTPHSPRLETNTRQVRGRVASVVPVESVDVHAISHLADVANSWGMDSMPFMTLADATDAVELILKADGSVDKGWFGTGLLKGVDPWGTWRGFIQGSIVSTHDFLYARGVTENTYGWSIVAFTFGLRSLTLPLTWFQYSSTEKQKALKVNVEWSPPTIKARDAKATKAQPPPLTRFFV